MATEEKARMVDELAEKLARSNLTILTDYRGLRVSEMNALRNKLRPVGVEYQVAKNTLTRFAAERVGRGAISPDLAGPTALVFGYQDPVAAARALTEYLRTSKVLKVKAGLLGERRLSPEEVTRLAELPPKEQLRAILLGSVQGPLAGFVGVLNGLLSSVAYAIDQRAAQLEGEGA